METLRCYQCNTCRARIGDKSRLDKSHDLQQINDRVNIDLFPPSIKVGVRNIIEGLSFPNFELVDQWTAHQKGVVEDGSTSSRIEIASNQLAFPCKTIEATKEFTHNEALASFVRTYYKNGNVTRMTLIIYLGSCDKFDNYVKHHKPALFPGHHKVIGYACPPKSNRYRKGPMKEKRRSKERLFARVPELESVATVYIKITEFCNDDVNVKNLSLKKVKCFNSLTLAFNLNGRQGPLIDLTWDAGDEIKHSGVVDCDDHKTGHFFTRKLKIHIEQLPWLERLREELIKQFVKLGKRVFGTSKDTEEHSM